MGSHKHYMGKQLSEEKQERTRYYCDKYEHYREEDDYDDDDFAERMEDLEYATNKDD